MPPYSCLPQLFFWMQSTVAGLENQNIQVTTDTGAVSAVCNTLAPFPPLCGKTIEKLRRLARSIVRRCSPEQIAAGDHEFQLIDAWPYGPTYVLERVWEELGVGSVLERAQRGRRFGFSLERALFAMVANRCCAPSSKLYCWEQTGPFLDPEWLGLAGYRPPGRGS